MIAAVHGGQILKPFDINILSLDVKSLERSCRCRIGHCARIAAGSVVLKSVPHNVTVAGVPATVVGEAGCAEPSRTMDQMLHPPGL